MRSSFGAGLPARGSIGMGRPPSIAHVAAIVPETDDRLFLAVVVTQRAEGGGAEIKIAAAAGVQTEPTGGQHTKDVAAGKEQDVAAVERPQLANDAVGAGGDVGQTFAARAAVVENVPAGPLFNDFRRR